MLVGHNADMLPTWLIVLITVLVVLAILWFVGIHVTAG